MTNSSDRAKLKKSGADSPDISEMEYRHYDAQRKITYYFKSKEKYLNFLKVNKIEASTDTVFGSQQSDTQNYN
ncbi:MAG: hypothetical protein ACK5M7_09645 [Draconibacterium sp.]